MGSENTIYLNENVRMKPIPRYTKYTLVKALQWKGPANKHYYDSHSTDEAEVQCVGTTPERTNSLS